MHFTCFCFNFVIGNFTCFLFYFFISVIPPVFCFKFFIGNFTCFLFYFVIGHFTCGAEPIHQQGGPPCKMYILGQQINFVLFYLGKGAKTEGKNYVFLPYPTRVLVLSGCKQTKKHLISAPWGSSMWCSLWGFWSERLSLLVLLHLLVCSDI